MRLREVGALFLVWLTACAGTPRGAYAGMDVDMEEAQLAAVRYELHVLAPDTGSQEPVAVSRQGFQRAMRMLAPELVPSSQPMELARLLMQGGLHAHLLAEVDRGQVVRMTPLEEGSPLEASSAAEYRRRYLSMCLQEYGGGDCLGLLADGPTLTKEDVRTLALALALKQVLRETGEALRGMVSPQAVVAMVVCTAFVYMMLWLLPEPASKLLAASLTVALLAWLPVHTVWSLLDGWARLVHEADRATSYEQIEEASERFSQVMGENTARVLVLLITTALAGSGAKFIAKLPKLPGFSPAAARIRHRGGNQQVSINGQRWHVPANRTIREIPAKDPVGDAVQEAAKRIAKEWSPSELSFEQIEAIRKARSLGEYLRARLMERRFRGQWVENKLRGLFKELRWSRTGVDAVDPSTGLHYEILTGSNSNMDLHGRRMAEVFFRLITF